MPSSRGSSRPRDPPSVSCINLGASWGNHKTNWPLKQRPKPTRPPWSSGSGLPRPFVWPGPGPVQGVRRTGRPAASAGPGGAAEALPLVLAPRTAAQRRGCHAGGTTEPSAARTGGFCPFLPCDEKGQMPKTQARLISTLSLRLFAISSSNCKL